MFNKNLIISGIASGVMLVASSFATPASAGQASFKWEVGIGSILNELFAEEEASPRVQDIQYNGIPIRKIRRKLRRRGLYPVSDYRVRGDVVILRAEDEFGTLFRVVADADYGNIIRIRRVRETRNYRRFQVDPPYYDDGYNKRRSPRYGSTHAERKAAKNAARAHARRKAVNKNHAQRKAAKARAHAARKAVNARADRNRRARVARNPNRPYIGSNLSEYEMWKNGSGR